jgi:hypothetical protein
MTLCVSQPIDIQHNVAFLIDNAKIKNLDDIECDDMGSWKHSGTPRSIFHVDRDKDGNVRQIQNVRRIETSVGELDSSMYILKRIY